MPNHESRNDIGLLDRFFYLDPWDRYRWMRDNAPVYWDASADGGLWGVTRYDDIMSIAKNPDVFCSGKSSRPERGSWIPSMINLDEPQTVSHYFGILKPRPRHQRPLRNLRNRSV